MARNVNEIEADEAEQEGHIMERDAFLDVLGDVNSLKAKSKKISGDTSARLTKAETQYNLDKKAFAVVASCRRMEPTRLNAFLRHFDAYRDYAELDTMAGQDMFEGAPGGAGKTAGAENGEGATETAPKAAKSRGRPKGSKNGPKGKGGRKKKVVPLDQPEGDTNLSFGDAVRQPGMALNEASETAGQG